MPPTTLHLIRHASHGLLGRVLVGRTPGVGLSKGGRAEADALAAALSGTRLAAIAASPVQRAQETAVVLAASQGLVVQTDAGLDEVDFGAWAGASFDALDGDPAWRDWNRFRSTAPTPGGETMLAVQARALDAVRRARLAHPGREVALVSHLDVLRAVLAHWLGMPLDLFQRIELAPASRSAVVLWEDGVRVDGVNLPPR